MARIKINDLPEDTVVSKEELKSVLGGEYILPPHIPAITWRTGWIGSAALFSTKTKGD